MCEQWNALFDFHFIFSFYWNYSFEARTNDRNLLLFCLCVQTKYSYNKTIHTNTNKKNKYPQILNLKKETTLENAARNDVCNSHKKNCVQFSLQTFKCLVSYICEKYQFCFSSSSIINVDKPTLTLSTVLSTKANPLKKSEIFFSHQ